MLARKKPCSWLVLVSGIEVVLGIEPEHVLVPQNEDEDEDGF